MLSKITEFFWQASHGRWEQTAATTTNQNRRNPFCASVGGDPLWVSHPTRKPYTCWYIQSQADALMFACVSSTCPSPWLSASVARTMWCAATSTPPWRSCPWRYLNSSSEQPMSIISSSWCCRSDEGFAVASRFVFTCYESKNPALCASVSSALTNA